MPSDDVDCYNSTLLLIVERGMGCVSRLEFDTLPREGGRYCIYVNDNLQESEGDMLHGWVFFQHSPMT